MKNLVTKIDGTDSVRTFLNQIFTIPTKINGSNYHVMINYKREMSGDKIDIENLSITSTIFPHEKNQPGLQARFTDYHGGGKIEISIRSNGDYTHNQSLEKPFYEYIKPILIGTNIPDYIKRLIETK